ncbi:MAG: hypothetical protein PUJ10_01020 [Lachnospiraceae bacterium]|jgi:hypothetical protein|nr:hypothetical protein [Lachnospiraceae bacterium]MDD7701567.1 hypothetical protein [Lachnospiraceae bacterium]MDY3302486.1 hypothetical protein [Lachnospiraceae bacterium]
MAEENKNEIKYEELYDRFMDYQTKVHEANQKRIRLGLKVNIFFPLIFLTLCFLTDGSKLIFLILWIVSLFGIAFYLMYVEYSDDKLQRQMKAFGLGGNGDMEDESSLISFGVENTETKALKHMENVDRSIEEKKQEVQNALIETKESVAEKFEERKKIAAERREERKENFIEKYQKKIDEIRANRALSAKQARAKRLQKKAEKLQREAERLEAESREEDENA